MIAESPGLQEQAFRGFSDLRRRETELVDHRKIVAALGKTVFEPQIVEGNRLFLQESCRQLISEPIPLLMIFRDHQSPGPAHRFEHGGLVDRLHRVEVENLRFDPFFRQGVRRLERLKQDIAITSERNVPASPNDFRATDFKRLSGLVELVERIAHEAHENRPGCRQGQIAGRARRNGIRGHQYLHVRYGGHEGDILGALVGYSVNRRRQAAMGSVYFNVQLGIADKGADRLQRPHGEEDAVSGNENRPATGRHACRRSHGVQLGNPHVEVAVGVRVAEEVGLAGFAEVAFKNHEIGIIRAALQYPLAERAPGRDFRFSGTHARTSRNSATARAYCSSLGDLACHSVVFSMKLTPLPLMVLAMTQTGPSRYSSAACSVDMISGILCPSTFMTFQLKASNFLSMGSIGITSSHLPSVCRPLRSTMKTRLPNLYFAAAIAASQMRPSLISPSPSRAQIL